MKTLRLTLKSSQGDRIQAFKYPNRTDCRVFAAGDDRYTQANTSAGEV